MKLTRRISAVALALTIGAGLIAFPTAARASEEGRRNTAIALGAAAAGLLLTQRDKAPGLVAAAGAAYAYSRYQDSRRHRWDGDYGYHDRYDRRGHDRDWDDRYDRRDRDDRHDRSYDRGLRDDDRDHHGDYGHRR